MLIEIGIFIALVAVLIIGAVVLDRARARRLQAQFRSSYPGKVALLAYTQNHKWSAFMRDHLVPRIGASCVVVDRSDAQWKVKNPLAARIIRHWGGGVAHNPLAVVFPAAGRPQVFRLYHAFRQNLKGKPHDLKVVIESLESSVQEELRRVA